MVPNIQLCGGGGEIQKIGMYFIETLYLVDLVRIYNEQIPKFRKSRRNKEAYTAWPR